ncbi:hypothetical protein L3X38_038143 [Prunus dulcis]|uniref:Uncharacterized protein n=1 Tax=Prunus dulcis TaxID=3755 RepID=A0AAD4V4H3_PRUDU|nr:hypothetical protein L3X38_038143 [Prunus dulcis]
MDAVFREHDIYFSAVQEEHRDANTSQISRLFPSELSQVANDWSQNASDRSPETLPENNRLQERTATGRLPAVKLRRRTLRSFCPLKRILQLQYHTNHLLRTSFR